MTVTELHTHYSVVRTLGDGILVRSRKTREHFLAKRMRKDHYIVSDLGEMRKLMSEAHAQNDN